MWHRQEEGEVQRWAGLSLGPNRLHALETEGVVTQRLLGAAGVCPEQALVLATCLLGLARQGCAAECWPTLLLVTPGSHVLTSHKGRL